MPTTSAQEKFAHELADMYDAEHKFLEAMGKMRDKATDEKLQMISDAVIAGRAAKAEHYEMAGYADLIDGAEMLKMRKAVKLLTENRDQEVSTARKLERLAPKLGKAAA